VKIKNNNEVAKNAFCFIVLIVKLRNPRLRNGHGALPHAAYQRFTPALFQ
jgi:hypothetical protein